MSLPLVLAVGGRSTEHDASLHSYRSLLDAMAHRLEPSAVVFVGRDGRVALHMAPPWPQSEEELRCGCEISIGRLIDMLAERRAFVFNLLHGNEGEDGAWQGIAEVANLHGTFGSVFASAITMNKWAQSVIAEAVLGPALRCPRTWRVSPEANDRELAHIVESLDGSACVVKPNRMGASHFAEPVVTPSTAALRRHIDAIAPYDPEILVQRYIDGIEYTCGCVECGDGVHVLPVIRATTARRFLGHREKHQHGLITADILVRDDDASPRVKALSQRLFALFDLSFMCRFDFIVDGAGDVWFLEGNAIPGLMKGSAFPKMLAAAGYGLLDLVRFSTAAFERRRTRHKLLTYAIDD